jgi:hypothetical protein
MELETADAGFSSIQQALDRSFPSWESCVLAGALLADGFKSDESELKASTDVLLARGLEIVRRFLQQHVSVPHVLWSRTSRTST